mgnify:CR=1 FL=1
MTRTIFVSRHRMTECPSCHAHVRVAAEVKQTACPFCETKVTARPRDVFALLRDIGTSTTGGVVAAALMGLGLVNCNEASVIDGLKPDSGDHAISPLYGIPPIDSGIADATIRVPDAAATGLADAREPVPVPAYGIAPQPDATTVADAQDPPPEPEYGIPPIHDDASVNDAEDPPPVALYGISPVNRDAGTRVEDAGEDTPVPLYGGAAIDALNSKGELLS